MAPRCVTPRHAKPLHSRTVDVAVRSVPSRIEIIARRTGLLGLYAMALSVGLSTAGFNVAAIIVGVVSIPLAGSLWRDLRNLPAFWLVTALTVYVLVQSLVFASAHPVMHESTNPHWSHMVRVAGLASLIIGWWMFRFQRHIPWLLLLVVAGLFANRLLSIDYPLLWEAPFAQRDVWGNAAVRVGFVSAAGMVLCFATLTQWATGPREGPRPVYPRVALVAVVLGFVGFLMVLYGSQTRGAWVGALVACLFLVIVTFVRVARSRRARLPAVAGIMLLAVGFAVIVALDPGNVLEERVTSTDGSLRAILTLDREALVAADRSLGLRLNMWVEALAALQERPWFGYGSGSKPVLAARADLDFGSTTGHLHNIYVEIAYSLGLVGLVGFVLAYGALFRGLIRAWRANDVPAGIALVTAGFWVMALVALLSDVGIGHSGSRALLIFMLAVPAYAALTGIRGRSPCEREACHRDPG